MALMHPELAFGMALAALPVLIHLFSSHRATSVRWAATAWIKRAMEGEERRIRRSDRSLLAVRVLLLLVAPLLLARPVLTRPTNPPSPSAAVIILDRSGSMQTMDGGQTRLAAAKARARELIATLPESSSVGVVGLDDRGVPASVGITGDRSQILAAIDRIEATGHGSRLQPALALVMKWFSELKVDHKTVYLITDGQESLFSRDGVVTRPMMMRLQKSANLVILPVGQGGAWNVSITDVRIERVGTTAGTPARIRVQVDDQGPRPADPSAGVELWIDGRKADRTIVTLSDDSPAAVFEPLIERTGLHAVEARLDPDACDLDNHRFAAFEVPSAIGVVVVTKPSDEKDLHPSSAYLTTALKAVSENGLPFVASTHAPGEDWTRSLDDERTWLLILSDAGKLPPEGVRRIGSFIDRGGGCWIAGSHSLSETLSSLQAGGYPTAAWFNLLILGRQLPPSGDADTALSIDIRTRGARQRPKTVEPIGLDQPGMRDVLAAVRLFDARSAEPATDSDWSITLRTNVGRSLLLTHDEARLALLTTSLDPSATDWPLRPAFVAMVDSLTRWLCEPRLVARTVPPGWSWRNLPESSVDALTLLPPSGKRIPLTRSTPCTLDDLGVYQLIPRRDDMDATRDARWAKAVNVDPSECGGPVWSPGEIASWLPTGRSAVIGPETPLQKDVKNDRTIELWPFLAAALLSLLVIESILAHAFSPSAAIAIPMEVSP